MAIVMKQQNRAEAIKSLRHRCSDQAQEALDNILHDLYKFDFLGKDSIRYQNEVKVERPVFEAIQQFRKGKKESDDLLDELDTSNLNSHLKELMPGLTAKLFRTYNASITLDDMLSKESTGEDVTEKVAVYQHANKEIACICNHQRTVSKSHSPQMLRLRLNENIGELRATLEELQDICLGSKRVTNHQRVASKFLTSAIVYDNEDAFSIGRIQDPHFLVDKDPEKEIPLFWAAINAGDRVDSALKDMTIVMKQQNRAEEVAEAIKSLRHCCSDQAQEALDNILLHLYKRCGRLDGQVALLRHRLFLIQQAMAFNGKRTKTARSQGKKFQVSVEQEATGLLNESLLHFQSRRGKQFQIIREALQETWVRQEWYTSP